MDHHAKAEEVIANRAADFLNREANRNSLITVIRAIASRDSRKVDILVSIFPEESEDTAMLFLKRKRSDLREYLKKTTRLRSIPTLDFKIDYGEKNREHIDKLSRE